jgi:transcriptional regulator with XRE-family HTH domain
MSKDKTAVVERLKAKILPENQIFVRKNLAISEQVEALRKEKGWTQKELAQKLGKTESEVSRLLSGLHNLTLKSIAKLEAELGSDIIITPLEVQKNFAAVDTLIQKADVPAKELTEELTTEYAEEPEADYQKTEKEENK